MSESDTKNRILDIGETLVRSRGYNGFSFRDISHRLAITNAAVHYYFRAKEDLVEAIITRFSEAYCDMLDNLRKMSLPPKELLRNYFKLYSDVMLENEGKDSPCICVCAVLMAEINSIPEVLKKHLKSFIQSNEYWISQIIEQDLDLPKSTARLIFSSLEGMMLIARTDGGAKSFLQMSEALLELI